MKISSLSPFPSYPYPVGVVGGGGKKSAFQFFPCNFNKRRN